LLKLILKPLTGGHYEAVQTHRRAAKNNPELALAVVGIIAPKLTRKIKKKAAPILRDR
jgi:hypothetical protein